MRPNRYMIAYAESRNALVEAVNKLAEQHWIPMGGITISERTHQGPSGYMQALWKIQVED